DKKRFRRKLRPFTRSGIPATSLRRFQGLRNRPRDTAPTLAFDFELLRTSLGQAVVFRAAIVFGVSPIGGNPTFLFHAVQRGKERAGLHDKSAAGDLLDPARDSQAVHLTGDQRFQDEHVQSSLQEGGWFRVQELSPIETL